MERFWKSVISKKANPLYWPVALLLAAASVFYRAGLFIGTTLSGKPLMAGVPVISVGNLTVGGTGKTPMTLELANQLTALEKKVGIVSSGYGRASKDNYYGTGQEIMNRSAEIIGDEVLMMAESIPEAVFGVGQSKSATALKLVEKYRPDLILVDDAFQHRKLNRDLNILLIDSRVDLRKESIFPLGRLREPIKAIRRADLIGITHCNEPKSKAGFCEWMKRNFADKPVIEISLQNKELVSDKDRRAISELADKPIYLFAGIGDGDSFVKSMRSLFDKIAGYHIFNDHCRYRSMDKEIILNDIRRQNPYCLVTTQKDYVKLKGFDFGRPLYYVSLHLEIVQGGENLKQEIESLFR